MIFLFLLFCSFPVAASTQKMAVRRKKNSRSQKAEPKSGGGVCFRNRFLCLIRARVGRRMDAPNETVMCSYRIQASFTSTGTETERLSTAESR